MSNNLKIIFTCLLAAFALSACNNTVKGFGEDMQQNGQSIQKSADKN